MFTSRKNRNVVCLLSVLCAMSQSHAEVAGKGIGMREALAQLPASEQAPARYAIVVGCNDYRDERVADLPACANDAIKLRRVLIDPAIGMFPEQNVKLLTGEQVTKTQIIDALDKTAERAGPDDLVIVFFSGHGALDARGRSYWLMHDTDIDRLRATALPETDVTELLAEIRTRRLVTLIDACYSAATAEIGKTKASPDLERIYPEFQGEGRVAITASKGDQLSIVIKDPSHPGYGYSAFAWHLVTGLEGHADADSDGVVTVGELWEYVKDRTARTSREQGGAQLPQIKGQLGSRFLLTINRDNLTARLEDAARARTRQAEQIEKLRSLALSSSIPPQVYAQAERLLRTPVDLLGRYEHIQRAEVLRLLRGDIQPAQLERALILAGASMKPQEPGATIIPGPPAPRPGSDPFSDPRVRLGTWSMQAVSSYEEGKRLRTRGEIAAARDAFSVAMRLDPTFSTASLALAHLMVETGELDSALLTLDQIVMLTPGTEAGLQARLELGILQSQLGRSADAITNLSHVLIEDAGGEAGRRWQAYKHLAQVRFSKGQYASALRLAKRAREDNPEQVPESFVAAMNGGADHSSIKLIQEPAEWVSAVPEDRAGPGTISTNVVRLQGDISPISEILSVAGTPGVVARDEAGKGYHWLSNERGRIIRSWHQISEGVQAISVQRNRLYLLTDKPERCIEVDPASGVVRNSFPTPGVRTKSFIFNEQQGHVLFTRADRLHIYTQGSVPRELGCKAHWIKRHPNGRTFFCGWRTPPDPETERQRNAYMDQISQIANVPMSRPSPVHNYGIPGYGAPSPYVRSMPVLPRSAPPIDWMQTFLVRLYLSDTRYAMTEERDQAAANGASLNMSADGRWIAIVGGGGYRAQGAAKQGYMVAVFDAFNLDEPKAVLPLDSYPRIAAFSPTSDQVLVASDGSTRVYDLNNPDSHTEIPCVKLRSAGWTGDGTKLVLGTADGIAIVDNALHERDVQIAQSVLRRIPDLGIYIPHARAPHQQLPEPLDLLESFSLKTPLDVTLAELATRQARKPKQAPQAWERTSLYSTPRAYHLCAELNTRPPESTEKQGVAIFKLRSLIQEDEKGYAPAHYLLGTLLQAQGRTAEAIACFERTVQLDAGRCDLTINGLMKLATLCEGHGSIEQATQCLALAYLNDTETPTVRLNLRASLLQLGKEELFATLTARASEEH